MRRLGLMLLLFSAALTLPQSDALDNPETTLAGINVRASRIADVQKLYGQQQSMYAVSQGGYPEGTKLYKWTRLTVTLKVLTEPAATGEVIRAIEVEGEGEPGKKAINLTGRGLSLGAKTGEIKKLYDVEPVSGSATIKWPDGTMLIVGVNEKGRVNRLELRAPRSPE